jgi:hypothetical protein
MTDAEPVASTSAVSTEDASHDGLRHRAVATSNAAAVNESDTPELPLDALASAPATETERNNGGFDCQICKDVPTYPG